MGSPGRRSYQTQSHLRLWPPATVSLTPHTCSETLKTSRINTSDRVIALAALQIHYVAQKLSSTNEPLDGVPTIICRQTEIFYAIMASTIPCLRPFLASFFTGFGAMGGETVIAGSQVGNSGSNSREKSAYALGSMQSGSGDSATGRAGEKATANQKEKRRSRSNGLTMMRGGRGSRELDNFGNETQNQAHVSHDCTGGSSRTAVPTATRDAASIASNESTKMIITKEVQWHVNSERGSMVRPL